MPKNLPILPEQVRAKGRIDFKPIPVNQYDKSIGDELGAGRYTPGDLCRIEHDMKLIRSFETMLDTVKKQGAYQGLAYNHRGPAHLSMGQEAAAVGQAFHLDADDHIFGSHRSHGEVLAKGLSAIDHLSDDQLQQIMAKHWDGATLRVVEQGFSGTVKELAIDFLVYGTLAEIFGRSAGFNQGFGGSMHAFFTPWGIYPNNAIVGGSADIAVGAALFKRVNGRPGIVVANIGDAAAGCGPVWEGLCFATMDQFRQLWPEPRRGGLPLILNFMNNFYGMGGQPVGETMGFGVLARLGAGLCPDQMHAERVDGFNPLAVADAMARKKKLLAAGDGPVLLDVVTYRFAGHSPSDASTYRDKAEVEAWQRYDPLEVFGKQLVGAGAAKDSELSAMQQQVEQVVLKAYRRAADLQISPRADLKAPGCQLEKVMFSNQKLERCADGQAQTLLPKAQNPRLAQIAGRSRSGTNGQQQALPKSKCVSLRDALFEAILDAFYTDPTLIAYGEENRDWGGAFAVYRGLTEALPYHRLFNAPISEGAIVGSACGYALEGGRALIELMYCDFMGRAGDQLFNQLAKWQAMSGGVLRMPVVVRVSVGSKYGAQHSQDWTSMCAHIPGLKVAFPATPYDAKGMLASALAGTDPVIFFESQRLYDMPEMFHPGGVPAEAYQVPLGLPDIKQPGSDLTILTLGATLYRALDAARELQAKWGLSCEVIDARCLVPFDMGLVLDSVRKTRKIVLVSDACERGSAMQTLAAKITQLAFDELDAPPVVVGARNWIVPADEVEDAFFPFPVDIIDAIHTHILPLKGYNPARACDTGELLRRSALGV